MDAWVRVSSKGRYSKLPYKEILEGRQVNLTLHRFYETSASFECMCTPDKPVPMHLRRIRKTPPTYAVVTNRHCEHAEGCPRYHVVHRVPSAHEFVNENSLDKLLYEAVRQSDTTTLGRDSFVPNLNQLNSAQREAATHKDGPCIVVAAAGSGKTAMLIARIKFLIDSGVDPRRILACTFTKKASGEMKKRLIDAVGESGKSVSMGTIHSIAYRMLMSELGEEWKITREPSWFIEQILEQQSKYNPHGIGMIMQPEDAVTGVYKAKADALWPEQVKDPLKTVYAAYEAIKTDRKQMDFEDLLLHSIKLFKSNPDFRKRWQNAWDYVLIDEFQDTNNAQWNFLLALSKRTGNLFAVGDDWQSIYGFRGARPQLMGTFMKTFPNAKKVFLTVNYRSNDLIVDLGNRVIELNMGYQINKRVVANRTVSDDAIAQVVTMKTDIEEARFVANEIVEMHKRNPNIPYCEYAILFRTNIQSRVYEEALAERNIPYHVVGDTHFYESRDVKLILDYLRLTQDTSRSELWVPLMNRPKRFISQSVIKEVQQAGWDAVVNHPKCRPFIESIKGLKKHTAPGPAIRWLVETQKGIVRNQDEDEPIKWVDSLISSASRYQTIPEFLRFVEWIIEQSKKPHEDAVQLLSIHRSKGLEYWTVFVVGLAEGLLPHNKSLVGESLREETRLCYVAITRAKENLFLLAAEKYGDNEREVSRFIKALQ